MNVLGIIPARGGSKGVPKKNIRLVNGRPLVHYSIIRGLESTLITDLYLSTDSQEIIENCSSFPSLKIHRRPPELAQDQSPTSDAVWHLLDMAESDNKISYDLIVILQPTSPLRLKGELDVAIKSVGQSNANALISVCTDEDTNPARMYLIKDDLLQPLNPELETKRRQELEPVYFRDGCFYIVKTESFRKNKVIMEKPTLAFLRKSEHLLNIDSHRDMLIAEVLLKEYFEL